MKSNLAAKHQNNPVVLYFDNVDFSYPHVDVLEKASFHIHQGEFIALVGPNGAGKTTVLKLILGLAEPTGGKVQLFNQKTKIARSQIGYVPQHADYDFSFPISVAEVVRMGRVSLFKKRYTKEDEEATLEALRVMELSDLSKRPYSALSGGQRRRVLVARALSTNPKMLILDEPTSNMDVESEKRLFDALGALKGKTTILIVTHDTSFVSSLTDRVLCVGELGPTKKGRTVVQHNAEPTKEAPSQLFGGSALRVLHDSDVKQECCFDEEKLDEVVY